MTARHGLAALAALAMIAASPLPGAAAPPPTPAPGQAVSARVLDVPYIAQSEDLCGGAALAMVRRYWGDQSAVAEDFADLVDEDQGGIQTGRLTAAAHAGSWTALALTADAGPDVTIASHIARGRPVIALIQDRPGVLHYVVVVAWTTDGVIYHDPARAPFQSATTDEFERRWRASGRWMLVVLPDSSGGADAARVSPDPIATPTVTTESPECSALITSALESAAADRLGEAETALIRAVTRCPAVPRAWRELAGVRFLQGRWAESAADASTATRLDTADEDAWRLLGASRYLLDDDVGALRAMNMAGQPLINRIDVTGAVRTPQPVVIGTTGLEPRTLLTAGLFARARRRLDALPTADRAALRFAPAPNETAVVEAVIVERRAVPVGYSGWGLEAARAVATSTIRLSLPGLTGSGERWTGAWRWAERRPEVRFTLATPSPSGLPGVSAVEVQWERQTYASGVELPVTQSRRRVSFNLSDWATSELRWEAGAAVDRFDARSFFGLQGGMDRRWLGDRLSVAASSAWWTSPGSNATSFGKATARVAMRSSTRTVPGFSAMAGVSGTSAAAPPAVWSRTGTDPDRLALLRAHPLHDEGAVRAERLGRRLSFVTVEHARHLFRWSALEVMGAVFVDAASIRRRLDGAGSLTDLDVGAGLRVPTPWLDEVLGLNVAYGTRDARWRLSVIVLPSWPY